MGLNQAFNIESLYMLNLYSDYNGCLQGMDLQWCRNPEVGLPSPDAVLFMTLNAEEAAKRASYGGERYERTEFQNEVAKNYDLLKQSNWKVCYSNISSDLKGWKIGMPPEQKRQLFDVSLEISVKLH